MNGDVRATRGTPLRRTRRNPKEKSQQISRKKKRRKVNNALTSLTNIASRDLFMQSQSARKERGSTEK